MVPTLIHGFTVLLKQYDIGFDKKLSNTFKGLFAVFMFGIVLIIVCAFLFVHWITGVAFIAAVILFLYVAAQVFMYIQNDFFV